MRSLSLTVVAALVLWAGTVRGQVAGERAVCAALPRARPSDLVIEHHIRDYHSPERLMRLVTYDATRPCPADDMPAHLLATYAARVCVPRSIAQLDALHAVLLAHHIDALRAHPLAPQPHLGGTSITLRWSGQACTLDRLAMHPADAADYAAIEAALQTLER